MDGLYFQSLETQGLTKKINSLKSKNYLSYISPHDPTRLDWNIATSFDELIISTVELYNLSKKMSQIVEDLGIPIEGSNLASKSFGKVIYKGITYLLFFYSPYMRVIPGNTFTSSVPINVELYDYEEKAPVSLNRSNFGTVNLDKVSSNLLLFDKVTSPIRFDRVSSSNDPVSSTRASSPKSPNRTTRASSPKSPNRTTRASSLTSNFSKIPLLVPLNSASYLLLDKKSGLLCPGSINFIYVLSKSSKTLVGVYNPLNQDKFLRVIQDDNLLSGNLESKWEFITPYEVVTYLTNYHCRLVQSGYYSPTNTIRGQAFKRNGYKFYGNPAKESYYESLTRKVQDLTNRESKSEGEVSLAPGETVEEIDETTLPLYEHPKADYIGLYCNKSCLVEGPISKPLFLSVIPNSEVKHNFKILVDVRTLDLNFIWTEKVRKLEEPFPEKGFYALSENDKTYLEYFTHSSGILVVLFGYIQGDSIHFSIEGNIES